VLGEVYLLGTTHGRANGVERSLPFRIQGAAWRCVPIKKAVSNHTQGLKPA